MPEYLAHVRAFLGWLGERGVEMVEVRTSDLEAYQSELLGLRKRDGKHYSLGFHQNRLTALKSLFRFLHRRRYLLQDPSRSIVFERKEAKLPRTILSEKEARRVIEAARNRTPAGLRDRAILETLYATGLRVTELANLTVNDADTEERTLRIRLGKGRRDRNVPMTHAAAEAIDTYLAEGRSKLLTPTKTPWLFVADHGGRMHRVVLSRLVTHYANQARIKKHVTCHTFRHSIATHLLRGQADIRHIQRLLGHASLQTTQRYTRVEISDLRQVLARAHPRG
ncbi:MAG: tyrosine-type recombinase/integrase [Thermoleophilia bacterium]|nr:tyrosine-type recombinase/integrase [Thermoleophilia bacterium]